MLVPWNMTGSIWGEGGEYLALVLHQLAPVDLTVALDTEALVALEALGELEGAIEDDLRVAPIVGAGSTRQVTVHDCDALAYCRQRDGTVPDRVAAAQIHYVVHHINLSFVAVGIGLEVCLQGTGEVADLGQLGLACVLIACGGDDAGVF